MNRKKPVTCPVCGQEQVVHLLITPSKFAQLIKAQEVRCVSRECRHQFSVRDTEKIVDGPFEI